MQVPKPPKVKPIVVEDLDKYLAMAPWEFGLVPFDERAVVSSLSNLSASQLNSKFAFSP